MGFSLYDIVMPFAYLTPVFYYFSRKPRPGLDKLLLFTILSLGQFCVWFIVVNVSFNEIFKGIFQASFWTELGVLAICSFLTLRSYRKWTQKLGL